MTKQAKKVEAKMAETKPAETPKRKPAKRAKRKPSDGPSYYMQKKIAHEARLQARVQRRLVRIVSLVKVLEDAVASRALGELPEIELERLEDRISDAIATFGYRELNRILGKGA